MSNDPSYDQILNTFARACAETDRIIDESPEPEEHSIRGAREHAALQLLALLVKVVASVGCVMVMNVEMNEKKR